MKYAKVIELLFLIINILNNYLKIFLKIYKPINKKCQINLIFYYLIIKINNKI
jgi:hypothetical protein